MAEKNLNSRIIHKHDVEANWIKATSFVPKQGEIVIYDIDAEHEYERIKIGDGSTLVSNLPFCTDHSHNYYGVCTTAAATAAKTVNIPGFKLEIGAMVIIKFDNANSASNPTLNVSGTGAKPMYRYGTTVISTGTTTTGWYADSVQMFVYDGTGWIRDYWNNTTYSNISLGQGYGTCATAAATVAKTVTMTSYALSAGGIVTVKFDNAVPANATMNINSKGAKAIYYNGAPVVEGVIEAGDVVTFIYSTNYHIISNDRWHKDISALKENLGVSAIPDEEIDEICGAIEYAEEVMF